MGKYDGVIGGLRREPTPRSARVEVIAKGFIESMDAAGLATEYAAARADKDRVEADLAPIQEKIDALAAAIEERFEADGVTSVRTAAGMTVAVTLEPAASVTDRDALREWAVANGHERDLALNHMTLQGIVRARLLAGDPEPDGTSAYLRAKISLRKA